MAVQSASKSAGRVWIVQIFVVVVTCVALYYIVWGEGTATQQPQPNFNLVQVRESSPSSPLQNETSK